MKMWGRRPGPVLPLSCFLAAALSLLPPALAGMGMEIYGKVKRFDKAHFHLMSESALFTIARGKLTKKLDRRLQRNGGRPEFFFVPLKAIEKSVPRKRPPAKHGAKK